MGAYILVEKQTVAPAASFARTFARLAEKYVVPVLIRLGLYSSGLFPNRPVTLPPLLRLATMLCQNGYASPNDAPVHTFEESRLSRLHCP